MTTRPWAPFIPPQNSSVSAPHLHGEATRLARTAAPDLVIDGELQFDSAFVEAVEQGKAPEVGFEDGRLALLLAEAAIRSVAEGRTVNTSEMG